MEIHRTEVVIVGTGIAGASAALAASDAGKEILLLSKQPHGAGGSTRFAQGGIAYLGEDDSPELLIQDIIKTAGEYAVPERIELLVYEGKKYVDEILLRRLKVPFDTRVDGSLDFGLESGHSRRRILHRGDETGSAIEQKLHNLLRSLSSVTLWKNAYVYDLLIRDGICYGVRVVQNGSDKVILAGAVVLATGGVGDLFLYSTNPPGSSGDGIALASRYSLPIRYPHFIQFHPTVFFGSTGIPTLITESVRGEGAFLENAGGEAFMHKYDPERKDLAPRRVVARAIHREIQRTGGVYLNIAPVKSRISFPLRFPFISEILRREGIFVGEEDRIPVAPAQHFLCGGIEVDEWGRTSVENLYAVGECSWTGVHGWDRLSSTSLLEGLVWGIRAGKHIGTQSLRIPDFTPPACECEMDRPLPPGFTREKWNRLKHLVWEFGALNVQKHLLPAAFSEILRLRGEAEVYARFRLAPEIFEFRSACWVAAALFSSLLQQTNSSM